jgi:chromosome segregation ATPase
MATNKAKERKQKELVKLGLEARSIEEQRQVAEAARRELMVEVTALRGAFDVQVREIHALHRERDHARGHVREYDAVVVDLRGELRAKELELAVARDERAEALRRIAALEAEERDARKLRRKITELRTESSERLTSWHRALTAVRALLRDRGSSVPPEYINARLRKELTDGWEAKEAAKAAEREARAVEAQTGSDAVQVSGG